MRVSLDYDPALRGHAGIARYVQALTQHLLQADESLQLYLVGPRTADRPRHPRIHPVTHGLSARAWRLRLLLAHYAGWSLDSMLPPVDLFHATDYVFPPQSRAIHRVVVSIHDLSIIKSPGLHTWMNRLSLRLFLRLLRQHRHHIITPSAAVRHDVIQLLHYDPTRVHIVYDGVHERARAPNHQQRS